MFEIWSIGDGAYLASILNAVAMMAGTGDFETIVRIGFGVGVLLIAFQGVMNKGQINWSQLLVSWVLFAALYGPGTRVTIEDAYTHQVHTVDNVPWGVAAIGSAFSQVGYGATRLFETAFGTPGLTEQSYGMSLHRLQKVRQATLDRIATGDAETAGGAGYDMRRSWSNYIQECTLVAIDLNSQNPNVGKSLDDVLSQPLPDALQFNSNGWYYTEIYVGGQPVTETCENAYSRLVTAMNTVFLPALKQNLHDVLSNDPAKTTDMLLQEALDGVEQFAVDPVQYLKAVYLTPIYHDAVVSKYEEDRKFTYASMVNEAIQKRNAQWTAQKSLFETTVQPMITFLEGFFYSVTPIMGFVIGLGMMGIRLAGKYIMLALWIQLWMPTLAIINHYLNMAMAGAMNSIPDVAGPAASIMGVLHWDGILQHYAATAGMLASSVPVITLFLTTGSYYALTHIAGKLEGQDQIDESRMAPSVAQRAPIAAFGSLRQYDPEHGMYGTGAPSVLTSFSWSAQDAATTSSAHAEMQAATSQFSETLGQKVSASSGITESGRISNVFREGSEVSGAESTRMLESKGRSLMDEWADTGKITRSQILALGAETALGGKSGAFSGGFTGRMMEQFGMTEEEATAFRNQLQTVYGEDKAWQAQFTNAVAQETAYGHENVFTAGYGLSKDRDVQRAASAVVQASDRYEQAVMSGVTARTDHTVDGVVGAAQIVRAGALDDLMRAVGPRGVSAAARMVDENPDIVRRFGGNEENALAYSMLVVGSGMAESSVYEGMTDAEQGRMRDATNRVLAGSFGEQGTQTGAGAYRNQGIGAGAPDPEHIKKMVAGETSFTLPSAEDIDQGAHTGLTGTGALSTPGTGWDEAAYRAFQDEAKEKAGAARAAMQAQMEEMGRRHREQVADAPPTERAIERLDQPVVAWGSEYTDRSGFARLLHGVRYEDAFEQNYEHAREIGLTGPQAEYFAYTNTNSTLPGEIYTKLFKDDDPYRQNLRSRLTDDEIKIIEDAAYSGNPDQKLRELAKSNAGPVLGGAPLK